MTGETEFLHKLAAAQAEMAAAGVKPAAASPPLDRLLAKAGFRLRPTLYAPFWADALRMGLIFALLWGGFMYVVVWGPANRPLALALIGTVVAGIMFGAMMGTVVIWQRWRKQLSRWEDL